MNENRLNLFIRLETIQAFLENHVPENLPFQEVFTDCAFTVDIIDAPQRLFFRSGSETAELELDRRGSMYMAEEQESLQEAHMILNQEGEVQGNAPQELRDVMQIYLMFCLNMAVRLREEGTLDRYADLDPEHQGLLVEENNDKIEMKPVAGKERPDLACKLFSGEVKMMRPYSEDMMRGVLLDAMPLERKEAAAEAGDTGMMQYLFDYYMGNNISPHKDLMNNMKKMQKLMKAISGEDSDEAEEDEEEEDTRNPERAFYWLKKLAESGDAESAKLLSKFYTKGFGCERDFVEAVRCLDGLPQEEKENEPIDFYNACAELQKKAEAGDPDAQCSYALNLSMLGRLVPDLGKDTDYAEAFKWAQKSASQNNLEGMAMLVTYYQQGIGVQKDEKKAFRLCEKAAMRGHVDSQERLARMYFDGIGTEKNTDAAIDWAKKAADQGDLWAMKTLTRIFVDKDGGRQDLNEARKWAKMAADLGDEEAKKIYEMIGAAGLSLTDTEESEAYARVRAEAENGSVEAMKQLASYYINRPGGKEDLIEAKKWAKMAADLGDEEAKKQCERIEANFNGETISFEEAKSAAESGNPGAQRILGEYYATGYKTEHDFVKARYWMQKAAASGNPQIAGLAQDFVDRFENIEEIEKLAAQGDADALTDLAEKYLGIGTNIAYEQDKMISEGLRLAERAAALGHPKAQQILGHCYENGIGVETDFDQALSFYSKAAEQGFSTSELSLATLYLLGKGTKADPDAAVMWLEKAEQHGDPDAPQARGMYPQIMFGMGLDKLGDGANSGGPDPKLGVRLLTKAAELGHSHAQGILGMLYLNGNHVEQDFEQAINWFRKAAENGNEDAAKNLEKYDKPEIYSAAANMESAKKDKADKEKVFRLMKHAAEGGVAKAQDDLGFLYMFGYGVQPDYEKGMEWFRKSAGQGFEHAQENIRKFQSADELVKVALAQIAYTLKTGLPDFSKAHQLLQKAAEAGSAEACNTLGVLYADPDKVADKLGRIGEQDRKKARGLFEKALEIKPDLEPARKNLEKLADVEEADASGREPNPELKWAIALGKKKPDGSESGQAAKPAASPAEKIEESKPTPTEEPENERLAPQVKPAPTEEELSRKYQAEGKCRYCGGDFKKGLFSTKCIRCGKKKDY